MFNTFILIHNIIKSYLRLCAYTSRPSWILHCYFTTLWLLYLISSTLGYHFFLHFLSREKASRLHHVSWWFLNLLFIEISIYNTRLVITTWWILLIYIVVGVGIFGRMLWSLWLLQSRFILHLRPVNDLAKSWLIIGLMIIFLLLLTLMNVIDFKFLIA